MKRLQGTSRERIATVLTLQPLERYDFLCANHDQGTHVMFEPEVASSVLGPLSSTQPDLLACDCSGRGVRPKSATRNDLAAPILESVNTIASLQQHLNAINASGFSVDLWITPVGYDETRRNDSNENLLTLPILSVARKGSTDGREYTSLLGCDGYEFQLAQRGPFLDISYADDDASRSCRHFTAGMSEPLSSTLTHVVISLSTSTTRVFINGKQVLLGTPSHFFDVKLRNWDPTYTVQLFSGSNKFKGFVHVVSLYGKPVSAHETELLFGTERDSIINFSHYPALGLVATPSNRFSVVQGRTNETAISIGGTFVSRNDCALAVEILSLPRHGDLYVMNMTHPLPLGSILALERNASRQHIFYSTMSTEYFNAPNKSANGLDLHLSLDSFDFRVIATHPRTNELLDASVPVSQPVRVLNKNRKPVLVAPLRITSGMVTRSPQLVTINGIYLIDKDMNVDKIRVDVVAKNGVLSLSDEYRHLADFHSCRNRTYSSWQCHGSGESDRSMTFLAEPDDVKLILKELRYRSFSRNSVDEVVVRAFDGVDGGCLTDMELPRYTDALGNVYASVKSGCQQVQVVVQVDLSFDGGYLENDPFQVPMIVAWIILGLIFLCAALCVKRSLAKCCRLGKSIPVHFTEE